jgi:hypothetical protein
MLALAIVALLTMGVATGVAFGAKQYTESTRQSEARILCSTLTSVLREELTNTTEIDYVAGKLSFSPTYKPKQSASGALSSIVYVDDTNKAVTTDYGQLALAAPAEGGADDILTPLIPAAAYSSLNDLKAQISVVPNLSGTDVQSFKINLKILTSDGAKTLTESTFYVMPLNAVKTS